MEREELRRIDALLIRRDHSDDLLDALLPYVRQHLDVASALRALPLAEVGNALELVAGVGRRQPGRAAMSRTSRLCRCVMHWPGPSAPPGNLFTTALPEDAMRAAVAADRARVSGASLGSLHGVPITVKNNIDVAGVPTTAGSPAFADRVATAARRSRGR